MQQTPQKWNPAIERDNELKAGLAQQEDSACRDNICIIGVPEGAKRDNMMDYIVSSIPIWFLKLAGGQFEIMKAHCIGPTHEDTSGSHTIICKMLCIAD